MCAAFLDGSAKRVGSLKRILVETWKSALYRVGGEGEIEGKGER